MVHVGVRLTIRGVPPIVKKDEVKNKVVIEAVRHIVKEASLRGDEIFKYHVCISIYGTKTFCFLFNGCKETKWDENHRQEYNN